MNLNKLHFKVHIPNLLEEIVNCSLPQNAGILFQPLNHFKWVLAEIADRCIEINDPVLNKLMFESALYEGAEPSHPEFKKLNAKINKEYNQHLKKLK